MFYLSHSPRAGMLQEALNDLQALSIVENEGSRKKYKKGFVQSQQFDRQLFLCFSCMTCTASQPESITYQEN